MNQNRFRFLPACLIALCLAVPAAQAAGKLAPELENAAPGSVKVIVQYRNAPRLDLIRLVNGVVSQVFAATNMLSATLPVSGLPTLVNDPEVVYISPDRNLKATLDIAAGAIGATSATYQGLTGAGVTVAVIDSGIDNHRDLQGRVVYQESFTSGLPVLGLPLGNEDRYGHGTVVAGILGGSGSLSSGPSATRSLRGIAPSVRLISLKALNDKGAGSDSSVIAAVNRAIQLKDLYGIGVVNMSLGRPIMESYEFDPLCRAVEAAWRAGLTVVVAAGNGGRDNTGGSQGYGTIQSPGNDPLVITVGAMRTMGTVTKNDDLVATYSSKGPTAIDHFAKPDLVAPGNLIAAPAPDPNSALARELPGNFLAKSEYLAGSDPAAKSKDYFRLSGTSMAAPMVSAAAAILLQREPSLTPDQIKARLMKTASKIYRTQSSGVDPATGQAYSAVQDVFSVGAGYLDIAAALLNRDLAPGTAHSPQAKYDPATGTAKLLFRPSSVWGGSVIWSDSVIWADGLRNDPQGQSVIWADRSSWADPGGSSVIWADSVRGTSVIWADSGASDN